MKKSRLDLLAVERGLFSTRQIAQTAIMDGAVLVNGEKVTKPGLNIRLDANIELIPGFSIPKYVSRGGLKLEKGLDAFAVDVQDRVCIDIGASTGGFTDCLLQRGAGKVYAVDVGYGQIDWSLRQDARVVVMERVNARYLKPEELYESAETARATMLVSDVSFISLTKILEPAISFLSSDSSELVLLIKPQFEVGRESVEKGGVVTSARAHEGAIETVVQFARAQGLRLQGLTYSPLTGPAGNIEYLVHFANFGADQVISVSGIVKEAFLELRS